MARVVRVRARGRAEVPAYGIADAEHLVEKEISRLWPGAQLRIESVSRLGPARIVEEFAVDYAITGEVEIEEAEEAALPSRAFAAVRRMLEGSRFGRAKLEMQEQEARSQNQADPITDN